MSSVLLAAVVVVHFCAVCFGTFEREREKGRKRQKEIERKKREREKKRRDVM